MKAQAMKILSNLLKVKSILTISTTIVFCVMLLMGTPIPSEFYAIYTTIVAFYFGTQSQKIKDGVAETE